MRASLKSFLLISLIAVLSGCNQSPQARRDKYLKRAAAYTVKRDFNRAIIQLRNALQATPRDAEVFYRFGMVYGLAGDYASAWTAFRKALELDPGHRGARLKSAELLSATRDPELIRQAQERLKELMEKGGSNVEMLNSLALTQMKLGDPQSAIQSLEEALTQSPGQYSTTLLLARAKLLENDPKGAEAVMRKLVADVPQSPDPSRLLAEFLISRNRMAEAEPPLRHALQIDPKNGPALMDLARLEATVGKDQEAEQLFNQLAALRGYNAMYAVFLFQKGRKDEAIREFSRLANANPDDREARTRLIQAYRMAGKPAEADKILADVLRKNPKDSDALLQHAEVLIQKGEFGDAEIALNQVLAFRPTAPEVHYILAHLYRQQGNRLLQVQHLADALRYNPALLPARLELAQSYVDSKQGRAALDLLTAAPELQRHLQPVIIERNWALWVLGDLAEMRKGIDQAMERQRTPDVLVQDGLWKMRSGNPAAARASLEEALKIDPSDLRAVQLLRQTYEAQNNTAAALQRVREYTSTQPKSAPAQQFLGLMLLAAGDNKGARTAFVTARDVDPHFAAAGLSLVQMDVAEKKIEEAEGILQTVLAQDANNVTAMRWLGNIEEMQGNHNAAIQHFQKVVALSPTDPQASNNLAYLLAEYRNQTDEALKLAQHAVELAPSHAAYSDTLGWVLYKKGLYSSAIPYLERANADSKSAVWKYHLAMAYTKSGDSTRGKAAFDAAFKINPNLPEARLAQEIVGASAK